MFLSFSVFFAIKEAIKSCRSDHGLTGHFRLDNPATSEAIRMACGDPMVQMVRTFTILVSYNLEFDIYVIKESMLVCIPQDIKRHPGYSRNLTMNTVFALIDAHCAKAVPRCASINVKFMDKIYIFMSY